MELFLQRCFDGLFNGAIYSSLAIAIVVIYRSTDLLNFAQGEMALVSGYVALMLLSPPGAAGVGIALNGTDFLDRYLPGHPWPIGFAIAGAVLFGALLGTVIERIVIRPLESSSPLSRVNLTIGLLILLNGSTVYLWGPFARSFPSPFPNGATDHVLVGGARLRFTTVGVWIVLIVTMAVLLILVNRTKTGLAFRAVTSSREGAALVGIRVGRTLSIGWAASAGLGALAATMIGGAVVLEPFIMMKMLIYAFAAATIGGLDHVGGAVVGGVIVGLVQSLAPGYLGVPTELTLLPPLVAMVAMLLVRPQGLFGTKPVYRV